MDLSTTQLLGAPSPSSSSSFTNSWTHDVFLSFRGEDTRYNFTDHLHKNLVQRGIRTFIDDELPRGEEISQALLDAIEGSRCSIIVFSENYASSKWCLDELVHIIQCRKSKQQMVWPVFYKVDPSDVRNQRGSYGEALNNHERKFKEQRLTNHDESKFEDNMKKVLRWKETLTEAANLSGSHYLEGPETEFIQNIVNEISLQVLKDTHINVAKYQVGIEARVLDIRKVLDVDRNDVRMVGIWGNGGIGKTTVAKAVYNSLAHVFEGSCFLENVRERSIPYGGLVDLQNLLLYEILRGKEIKVTSADKGISVIKERLSGKKVLVIVDDVDHLDQLNNLVGGCDWFGLGSRIIITTRDKHLLRSHQVSIIYKAKKLNFGESLDLFISWNGGRNKNLDDDYVKAAETVVKHAQGLPLALKVLGSHLCGRSIDEWHDALDGNLHSDIKKTLKISYDALEYSVQEVFLDIACFFNGRKVNHVIPILEGCDLKPKYAIKVLVDKALINIEQGIIGMHDLLEELGRGIVYQESPDEPGERSRLWFHEDVYRVLTEGTGTNNIKGIIAKFPTPDDICLSGDSFSEMKNLRLFINVNARFYGDHVDYLSNELRFLHWPDCPLQTLPSTFNPSKLVELYMPCSRLSQLGEGFKRLQNLKSMNFESCEFLTKTPNISGIPNLQSLNLDDCTSLVEVHPSVGFHDKLVDLSLVRCYNLTLFPIIQSKSLQVLNLEDCRRLETFPEIGGKMDSLRCMFLSGSGFKELPASIAYLISLEFLDLRNRENLTNLPPSIYELEHLNHVCLQGSRKLVTFPNKVKSEVLGSAVSHPLALPRLEAFTLEGSNLSEINFLRTLDCVSTLSALDLTRSDFLVSIPVCIMKFVNLRELYLHGCKRLQDIPELPPKIVKLEASDCISLERFSSLSNILKGKKDSQMIELVDLCNCQRLCGNLARDLPKKPNILPKEQITLFFDHLLSSQKHGFQVVFPASFEALSTLFSCHNDVKERDEACELLIEIPPNFKCQNQGLALYAAVENPQNKRRRYHGFLTKISVNQPEVVPHYIQFDYHFRKIGSGHVWLCYIRFREMFYRDDQITWPQSPFACQVNFQNLTQDSLRFNSFGVHLVMTQDDDDLSIFTEDGESESDDLEDANDRSESDESESGVDLCEDEQDSEHDYFSCEDNEDGYFY
ncbi:hypothetical protein PRUPE_8G111500 [Prunus persica]|uniref:TIR domain-containing protein n=1 Tax=Prunus persica TaxID=3760 RepID=A0A251MWC4_PRUPE|nr:TMV resistance protein N [Prunus persica]XP_020425632.1 TMV resistance protein N [Prunus persica]ONH91395.1 hypothetical protein PRUPE_8G111500 [Prunus persica]